MPGKRKHEDSENIPVYTLPHRKIFCGRQHCTTVGLPPAPNAQSMTPEARSRTLPGSITTQIYTILLLSAKTQNLAYAHMHTHTSLEK